MKKNYIAPEMDLWEADVQPLCLSEDPETPADPTLPGLAKPSMSIFDDSNEPAIED